MLGDWSKAQVQEGLFHVGRRLPEWKAIFQFFYNFQSSSYSSTKSSQSFWSDSFFQNRLTQIIHLFSYKLYFAVKKKKPHLSLTTEFIGLDAFTGEVNNLLPFLLDELLFLIWYFSNNLRKYLMLSCFFVRFVTKLRVEIHFCSNAWYVHR